MKLGTCFTSHNSLVVPVEMFRPVAVLGTARPFLRRQLMQTRTGMLKEPALPHPAPSFHGQRRSLLTAQRAVVFPPNGRRPLFIYAVFIFSSAAWEIWNFYASGSAIDDIGRKARSGEAIFGPTQTAKALVLLDAYANAQDSLWGDTGESEGDFPNMIPRIIQNGAFEALSSALQSSDTRVMAAAAELARTISSRPYGAELLMKSEATRQGLLAAFEKAVNSKVCKDCGGSSAFEIFALTETLKNCLPHYPFGVDSQMDVKLKGALSNLSTRAATFVEKQREGLVIDPEFRFPGGSDSGHPWLPPTDLTNHDSHWFVHIANLLLDIGVRASFVKHSGSSSNNNATLVTVLEPTLANLNRMYRAGVYDEEQEVYFGLLCMEALQRSKGLDPAVLESAEEFSRSVFFRHAWSRTVVRKFMDNADFMSTAIFAGAFGYIWGVARTLFALRDVAPPTMEVPSIADQPHPGDLRRHPVPTGPNTTSWRWAVSRQYGGRAALGAIGFTLWAHLATTTFGRDVWISSDAGQVAFFTSKVMAGVVFAGYLFKNFPFFFFPSVMARATDLADMEHGSVHISIGPRGLGGSGGGGGKDGDSGSRWT